jgi:hypothetical protein
LLDAGVHQIHLLAVKVHPAGSILRRDLVTRQALWDYVLEWVLRKAFGQEIPSACPTRLELLITLQPGPQQWPHRDEAIISGNDRYVQWYVGARHTVLLPCHMLAAWGRMDPFKFGISGVMSTCFWDDLGALHLVLCAS